MFKNDNGPIIGIDLGTIQSCVGIMRNGRVDIVPEANSSLKIISSTVCFTPTKTLIGTSARNEMRQFLESSMFESKRLLGHKYSNPNVQEDIKRWPLKIIEDPKTKKPKYVVKVNNKDKEYFPEEVSSMILEYLKEQAKIYNGNKEIKRAVITVPAHFNNLQREATIEAAKKAGLEIYKIINEPTAAAIAYGDIIKSDNERKVLIFDIGGGTFDVSIVKIKGNEYEVLGCDGEEHLGGEDINQRLFDYVIKEIKKDKDFEKYDFYKNKKDDIGMFQTIKSIRSLIEEVKLKLTSEDEETFFYNNLCGIKNFQLIITRSKFEELCMDLWKKCFERVEGAFKIAKLNKKDINEIILVGGSTRIPKIQKMVKDFFGKDPLRNIDPDEVVAYGATLAAYLTDLDIKDTTSKNIGISIGGGKMTTIIPRGLPIPLVGKNLLRFEKEYTLGGKKNPEQLIINIYEGNSDNVLENTFLQKFTVWLDKKDKEKKIKISMILDHNSILKVNAKVNNGKDNEIKINMDTNEHSEKREEKYDKKSSSSFIGVDLGTTTSCVGIMNDDNEIEILQDRGNGSRLIPSVVCFTNETIYVGESAINIEGYSKSKIYESKRLIGHKWDDKIIEEDIKRSNVKIIKDKSGYLQYSFKKNNEEIKKYPEEISLEILKHIKKEVEIKINKTINNIVITIPAHYDDNKKSIINKICEQSGFKEIKMINEPTAAGIAYLYEIQSDKLKTILIFDIGGGNFGVSILQIKGKEYKVLASDGEEHLGGEDFNRKLFDYVIKEIKKDQRFKNINLEKKDSENPEEAKKRLYNLFRIKKAVENLKNKLSDLNNAQLSIEKLNDSNDFKLTIETKKYQDLCEKIWEKIFKKLNQTFENNNIKKTDIEQIILIGGSSRTPGIQAELKNQGFKEKVIFFKRNSEEFTSMGATLYGNEKVKENIDLK